MGCEANYLCCTLVPRMPIEGETNWLIRKGSLLQNQCLLWSQAPFACCCCGGGPGAQPPGTISIPRLSLPCTPKVLPCIPKLLPSLPQWILSLPSVTSQVDQHLSPFFSSAQVTLVCIAIRLTYFWSIISSN